MNCHLESTRDEDLWRVQTELAESEDSSFIPFNMKFRIYKNLSRPQGNFEILTDETPEPADGEEYEDYRYVGDLFDIKFGKLWNIYVHLYV